MVRNAVRLFAVCSGNRRASLRLESGRKSRLMNLSSVYLRRSGCLYMYTGPILPPAATSGPDTCLAGASLYSWSVPVQLERRCVRGTATQREKTALYLISLTNAVLRKDVKKTDGSSKGPV